MKIFSSCLQKSIKTLWQKYQRFDIYILRAIVYALDECVYQ